MKTKTSLKIKVGYAVSLIFFIASLMSFIMLPITENGLFLVLGITYMFFSIFFAIVMHIKERRFKKHVDYSPESF